MRYNPKKDWNDINPNGGWVRGRENVLKEVREVHTTFLKDVTDTVEAMTVSRRRVRSVSRPHHPYLTTRGTKV